MCVEIPVGRFAMKLKGKSSVRPELLNLLGQPDRSPTPTLTLLSQKPPTPNSALRLL